MDKNEVGRAYNRATYLDKKIELMAWWGLKVYSTATITKENS